MKAGFALQLVTVRWLGTFLENPLDVSSEVLEFVAAQLEVADPSKVKRYTERAKTRFEHQWEIRQACGLREFAEAKAEFVGWAAARSWTSGDGPKAIFLDGVAWLRERKILLPGVTTLARLVAKVRDDTTRRLWGELEGLLTPSGPQPAIATGRSVVAQAPKPPGVSARDSARRLRAVPAPSLPDDASAGPGPLPLPPVPAGDILLYRFATRPCRQSWNTDAMTRRPIPTPQEQAQDQVKNASVRSGARARRVAQIYGLKVDAVTPDDRDAVRQAGAEDARRPRAVAGLPERIEDPAVVALLAGLLREPGPAGVVRSGRCPACGYLYGSGGHQVSCELPA